VAVKVFSLGRGKDREMRGGKVQIFFLYFYGCTIGFRMRCGIVGGLLHRGIVT